MERCDFSEKEEEFISLFQMDGIVYSDDGTEFLFEDET